MLSNINNISKKCNCCKKKCKKCNINKYPFINEYFENFTPYYDNKTKSFHKPNSPGLMGEYNGCPINTIKYKNMCKQIIY